MSWPCIQAIPGSPRTSILIWPKRTWKTLVDRIWPFIKGCDFSFTVDLAAGKGRNSAKLIDLCQALYVMDINKSLVDHCRGRFSGRPNITYAIGNGYDVTPVPDYWATLVYCFDAMVHFDSDVVRSYLRDLRRALRPGGKAFLHHSNLTSETSDWRTNTCARNFMSLELLATLRQKGRAIHCCPRVDPMGWPREAWMAFRYLRIHFELAVLTREYFRIAQLLAASH